MELKRLGLWETDNLFSSLDRTGILVPVLADERHGVLHLIDGFKRVVWSRSRGVPSVPVRIVPADITAEEIFIILLSAQEIYLKKSPVLKARFLSFVKEAGVPEETIVHQFMPMLQLGHDRALLKKYLKISGLPDDVLLFCHQKGFSLKRCLNLANHKRELLTRFFHLRGSIAISASLAEEMLNNMNDYLRREAKDPEYLFARQDIQGILKSDMAVNEKTQALRSLLRELRFPTLSRIERQMDDIARGLPDLRHLSVSWDRSLENRRITITGTVQSLEDFRTLLGDISRPEMFDGIKALLHYL